VRITGIAALAVVFLSTSSQAENLSPELIAKIDAATFEVVAAKPVDDPLTYEKPLPLELLPFQERNDKYFSIGTAFSIGGNRYVTAGHVLMADLSGFWGPPELRDAQGHVYAINKIEKFSAERDFVVFSLAAGPGAAPLETNDAPDLNSTVYTVGNALGTGVVVREGLYTSNTPEEQDGRWNFMRFSAAASPGNSGGPLLDKSGKVIGVVLRKSPSENLNYALPIAEVLKAPDHLAEADSRTTSKVDLFDTAQIGTFKTEFPLPLGFSDFAKTYQERANAFADHQQADLLAKEANGLFPNGAGARRLLHSSAQLRSFPALITRNSDGIWTLQAKEARTPLSDNGYIEIGVAANNLMIHWHRPDGVSAREAYGSPDRLMQDLLSIGFLTRSVATEKIKITALGKPIEDSIYTDRWQRRWQVHVWPLAYGNVALVSFALPVPDGYAVISRVVPAQQQHDILRELKLLTDFTYVAYEGTLGQWRDFLSQASLLPALFSSLKIDFTPGSRFTYASDRVSFAAVQDVQAVTSENVLALGMNYYEDHGKVVWDVADIRLKRTNTDNDWVNVQRHIKPSDDQIEAVKNVWDKITHQTHPFDGVSRTENDVTKITTVVAEQPGESSGAIYTAFVGVTGAISPEAMKAKMDIYLKDLHVKEH
jgi:S1-C subfamily serine protease